MKILRQSPWFVLLLLTLLVVTGCNTVSVNSYQYVGGPAYAATPPAQVEVLRAFPTRPYVKLGEITAVPARDSVSAQKIELKLQQTAATMGADAVVITSDGNQVTGAMVTGPWYGRNVQTITSRVVVGVAIHYTGK